MASVRGNADGSGRFKGLGFDPRERHVVLDVMLSGCRPRSVVVVCVLVAVVRVVVLLFAAFVWLLVLVSV